MHNYKLSSTTNNLLYVEKLHGYGNQTRGGALILPNELFLIAQFPIYLIIIPLGTPSFSCHFIPSLNV